NEWLRQNRLPVEEAVHLAVPARYHDAATFLDNVAREAALAGETEAAYGSEAAARVLAAHVTEGELAKVRAVLPAGIATFLPGGKGQ
ncbi:MAG: DUF2267 domain-containing protein, partial [Actinomycetes bacterium]